MNRIVILMSLLIVPAATTAYGQLRPITDGNAEKRQSIVTNGELTAEREFHLLIIHNGDAPANQLLQMCRNPTTKEMQSWAAAIEVRPMLLSEPFIEHHADLVAKWPGQTPIVALVDRRGGVWWSAGAGHIPASETQLSTMLNTAYSQTLEAARKSQAGPVVPPPVQGAVRPANQRAPAANPAANPGGSYFLHNGGGNAIGYRPPQMYTGAAVSDAAAEDRALRLALIIGGITILCVLVLAASPVVCSMILGAAITEDDHQENE